jgi:hypothetical protein
MGVFWNIVRAIFIAAAIVAVAEVSKRSPRYSALLLSLPIIIAPYVHVFSSALLSRSLIPLGVSSNRAPPSFSSVWSISLCFSRVCELHGGHRPATDYVS